MNKNMNKNKAYKYNCSTFEVLMWESEQSPKPKDHLMTIPAEEGDSAIADGKEYVFKNGKWEVKNE